MTGGEANVAELPAEMDSSRAHEARVYDYFLGGTNNFEVDREAAAEVLRNSPTVRTAARENRAFLGRAVRYLATEGGIHQFLDIGAGLPATASVHSVAQAVDPSARVVYADNDPLVLSHARSLLAGARPVPEAHTAYIQADLRDPATILADPVTREVLDFRRPIGLIMVAILHFLQDADEPAAILATLLDAMPSGSYLAASHLTPEHDPTATEAGQRAMRRAGMTMRKRDSGDFARLAFRGLDLVPPGVVLVSDWRPVISAGRPAPAEVNCYGGVARKP